jgi:hypothetical protein
MYRLVEVSDQAISLGASGGARKHTCYELERLRLAFSVRHICGRVLKIKVERFRILWEKQLRMV